MTPARLKLTLLAAGLLLSGLVFLGWTQEWFSLELDDARRLSVGGDAAAPALSVLALTTLVLIGALAIAGPFFRVVLGVLQSALGGTMLLSALVAIGDPVAASTRLVSEATGVTGSQSIAAQVSAVSLSGWPWLSIVAAAGILLLGATTVTTSRRWPGSSRKYSPVRLERIDGTSAIDDWDALSDGNDPT